MSKSKSTILVTGSAGFIGASLVKKLILMGENVIGIDNLNKYYDQELKKARLNDIKRIKTLLPGQWKFYCFSLQEKKELNNIFVKHKPKIIVNLAAQAGVRYSIKNPSSYIQSNLVGFANLLEECRHNEIDNLIYASSSSVYGGNCNTPFSESQNVNHPISLYAATKKANELMAHTYSHLYNFPSTGLRFFTVYGPWGRPDMAPMLFAKAIMTGEPINIFNHGRMKRDFTYIDDITEALVRCCFKKAESNPDFDTFYPDPASSFAPYRIFNIGNSRPVQLMNFIEIMEEEFGIKAIKNFQPIQPGDVISTEADTNELNSWIDFSPQTSIEIGIAKFAKWFKSYYKY